MLCLCDAFRALINSLCSLIDYSFLTLNAQRQTQAIKSLLHITACHERMERWGGGGGGGGGGGRARTGGEGGRGRRKKEDK